MRDAYCDTCGGKAGVGNDAIQTIPDWVRHHLKYTHKIDANKRPDLCWSCFDGLAKAGASYLASRAGVNR